MRDYQASTYGDRWAEVYDSWVTGRFSEDMNQAAVSVLTDLAVNGNALELGIGTGRIALPLAQRGLEVHGIDSSEAMVAKMREKPGGDAIRVTLTDFADFDVDGRFGLIFVAFNTFFVLTTQEQQLACFRSVARHLDDAGTFVIEAFMPDPARFHGDQAVRTLALDTDQVQIQASRHDPVSQTIETQHVTIRDKGIRLRPPRSRRLCCRCCGSSTSRGAGGSRTHVPIGRLPFGAAEPAPTHAMCTPTAGDEQ